MVYVIDAQKWQKIAIEHMFAVRFNCQPYPLVLVDNGMAKTVNNCKKVTYRF